MRSFFRAFGLAFFLGLLFFVSLALFAVVAVSLSESGFSSGAFFQMDFWNNNFFGEFLGHSVALNFASRPDLSPFRPLEILLPPPLRAFIKILLSL